ncbi:MAG: hypothetical protein ACTSRU_12555 [Candidatus Hodarchaeales archaeon]
MLNCRLCGRQFDPDKEGVGHVDDHIEICKPCYPEFLKKIVKESISGIGKYLARWYRVQKQTGATT